MIDTEMIPKSLTEWNIPVITNLLAQGYYETQFFDFKEMLPNSKNGTDKTRLSKSCCAFANSLGGFLIFGVKDDRSLSPKDRLIGIDSNYDLPEHFGNYPKNCNPSIGWNFLNPPLLLENGNVIHVIEVPRSWNAPHCIESSDLLRCFPKRTHKGNEDMSYEEIRMAFLQYYEKRLKLQLLQAELHNIKNHAEKDLMINGGWDAKARFGIGEFGLSVIETVLADTYTIIAEQPELLDALTEIRNRCRKVNDLLRIFYRIATLGWGMSNTKPDVEIEKHNFNVEQECRPLIYACDRALSLLEKIMKI
jgi:hypothetical protein